MIYATRLIRLEWPANPIRSGVRQARQRRMKTLLVCNREAADGRQQVDRRIADTLFGQARSAAEERAGKAGNGVQRHAAHGRQVSRSASQ